MPKDSDESGAQTSQYIDLREKLPDYECSKCGWLHDESDAWGIGKPNERVTCPQCNALAHSKERNPVDYNPNDLTGYGNRTVKL